MKPGDYVHLNCACIPRSIVLFVLATVPLLFGAVHPIVQSTYVTVVLLGLGGWLLYSLPEIPVHLIAPWWLAPVILLLVFAILQSIPLPFAWVELLSPARAARVEMVNILAETKQTYVSLSDQGAVSLQQAIFLLALLVYYFSVRVLLSTSPAFMHAIVAVITLLGMLEALYGLCQVLNPRLGILWLPIVSRAAYGTIIYKNQYASLLNLCWPLTLASAILYLKEYRTPQHNETRPRLFRQRFRNLLSIKKEVLILCFVTGIILLAVLFSLSRGGIVAMLIVLVSLNFYLSLPRAIKIISSGFVFLFIVSYGMPLGFDAVLDRFNTFGDSGGTRFDLYIGSLKMLADHWRTGIGLGSYTLLSPVYLKGFPPDVHFDHVHNEYLQLAIELGVPAALVFFSGLGAGLFVSGKKLFTGFNTSKTEVSPAAIIGGASFCALLGFFLHALVDFEWRLPANLFFAVTLAALVSYSLEIKQSKKARSCKASSLENY